MLAELQDEPPDGVIVAGDFVGGPHPAETIRMLRDLGAWMIRGNGDSDLLKLRAGRAPAAWSTSQQFALLRWADARIDKETCDFLASLPEQHVVQLPGTDDIRVVHGSPRNPAESIFPYRDPVALDRALVGVSEPVLVCGHTHMQWVAERPGRLALNPGAVAGPLDGQVGAQYAMMSWQAGRWRVNLRTVPYDLDRIRADFVESGLLQAGGPLARAFLCSIECGRDVAKNLLTHAWLLAGKPERLAIPDEVWLQAAETFDWDGYR